MDSSKAFDQVHRPALWRALFDQGVPDHLVWIFHCVYFGQSGVVVSETGQSKKFNVTGGLRQGCVLSPRCHGCFVRCCNEWRAEVESMGFNLMDGGGNLFDLRHVDYCAFAYGSWCSLGCVG